MASAASICEVGGGGLVLPLFGDSEQRWPQGLRIIIYLLGLGWCFMGVAIVSDVFMSAIECITSKRTRKLNPETQRYITVQVWNPTVANLTLMALGSSAPEILLSVIELLGNDVFNGDLGPSTIVGSAAFNLFGIMAVCVSAIPDGQIRKIKETSVYCVTASCSIWAYVWLLIILMGFSPNVVEIWEGVLTFLMFPVLVLVAFAADKGYLSRKPAARCQLGVATQDMTKEELAELEAHIRQEYMKSHHKTLTDDQVARIILVECANPSTRAQYRVAAVRAMVGGKRVRTNSVHHHHPLGKVWKSLSKGGSQLFAKTGSQIFGGSQVLATGSQLFGGSPSNKKKVHPYAPEEETRDSQVLPGEVFIPERQMVFEFQLVKQAILESMSCVTINVIRSGQAIDVAGSVSFKTREGTAKAPEDFVHTQGTLKFAKGEEMKSFEVKITDDLAYEDDQDFFVDLLEPQVEGPPENLDDNVRAVLGVKQTITVVIIDDDAPGALAFPKEEMTVAEGVMDTEVEVKVLRKNGGTGSVSCKYRTEDATAIAGVDYDAITDGTIEFGHGQLEASFKVTIRSRGRYERKEYFRVILSDPSSGLKFDAKTDGGEESCILSIFIAPKAVAKARIDQLIGSLQVDWEKAKLTHANWFEQFRAALFVNGGEDCADEGAPPGQEGDGSPSYMDYIMHAITLPWKLLFAFVPPVDYCGGWACFGCSLGMIGVVTAIIGDVAGLLGCVMEVQDCVTAITFVALGTSLPDTFASKTAAVQDPYADASVGNVTGSNSVNVFLGLGLPWMLGAVYWVAAGPNDEWNARYLLDPDIDSSFKSGAFIVKAGDLGFSVIVFTCCAVATILILYVRRRLFGGELGGPKPQKYLTSGILACLWVLYVSLSAWKCSSH